MRLRRVLTALVAAVPLLLVGPAHASTSGRLLRVPQDFASVTQAVSAAKPYDFILVGPGTYKEAVIVKTPHLTIRGVDRNLVVFEGDHKLANAFEVVSGANGVEVSNITAQNYQSNSFFWHDVVGYKGTFLTAINNVEYGIYAFNSTIGEFTDSYASGNGDSGFYIGGCFDCKALISRVHAENNGLGYSGTNAGGIVINDSEWDNNMIGILPNTLPTEPSYPQGGQAGVTITNNYVHDNNNDTAPSTFSLVGPVGAYLGVGIGIAGGWNNRVIGNHVVNHKHYGIVVHYLTTPSMSNQVLSNNIEKAGDSAISFDGNGAQNCWAGNYSGTTATEASSDPPMLQQTNGCTVGGAPVGGDPLVGLMTALRAAQIEDPHHSTTNQPHPGAQERMADPCTGAPSGCGQSQQAMTVAGPSPAPVLPPAGALQSTSQPPIFLPQVMQGLQAKPTQAEMQAALAAALANLHPPEPVVVRVQALGPDAVGAAAIALAALSAILLAGAGLGWIRRQV
jgi:hypothetical protein